MKIQYRLLAILALALVVLAIAFGGVDWVRASIANHRKAVADTQQVSQAIHAAKAEEHEKAADAVIPTLKAHRLQADQDDSTIAQDREDVDHRPAPPPPDPLKDKLIGDLTTALSHAKATIADQQTALDDLTQANSERRAQVKDLQEEVINLRAADSARPRERSWAVGGTYSVNGSIGAWTEKNFGPVRLGLDIVRRALPGRQFDTEVLARAGWSF